MFKKYLFFFFFLVLMHSCAIASNKSAVTIQSDHLEYHHQTGVAIHTGHVVVQQHNQILKADRLSIYRDPANPKLIDKMVAKGSKTKPATFEGQLNTKQSPISGHAESISYFPITQKLILEGNALLTKEQDSFSSPIIHFDLASGLASATKDSTSRPTVVIYHNEKK